MPSVASYLLSSFLYIFHPSQSLAFHPYVPTLVHISSFSSLCCLSSLLFLTSFPVSGCPYSACLLPCPVSLLSSFVFLHSSHLCSVLLRLSSRRFYPCSPVCSTRILVVSSLVLAFFSLYATFFSLLCELLSQLFPVIMCSLFRVLSSLFPLLLCVCFLLICGLSCFGSPVVASIPARLSVLTVFL